MAKKKFVSGVGEWASHSLNIQSGCENSCLYCFARATAARYKTHDPVKWKEVTINEKAVKMNRGKKEGTIMAFTTHDIVPSNVNEVITVLKKVLEDGNFVLIVSKPNFECIKKLCVELMPWKSQILFRFTIGSANDDTLKKWEPGAPNFMERLKSLIFAYKCGYQTSVSCEPMLDQAIHRVIETTRDYVTDAIWLGKPNKVTTRIVMNNPNDPNAKILAKELEDMFPDGYIWTLYGKYKDDPIIRWKDSIKEIVGLPRATQKGLDK